MRRAAAPCPLLAALLLLCCAPPARSQLPPGAQMMPGGPGGGPPGSEAPPTEDELAEAGERIVESADQFPCENKAGDEARPALHPTPPTACLLTRRAACRSAWSSRRRGSARRTSAG